MDDNVRALRHLRYQAEHDAGCGIQRYSPELKTDAAELLAARGDRKYSLWYCDIRNFKFINDIYGYDIGDELLSYLGRAHRGRRAPGRDVRAYFRRQLCPAAVLSGYRRSGGAVPALFGVC